MLDKAHLRGEKVVFRMVGSNIVNTGVVLNVEDDGFWIESQDIVSQHDLAWGPAIAQLKTPVFFVPTSSLMFLIASKE